MDEAKFARLLGRLYEAPGSPEMWPRVVSELAHAFDAEHGHLLVYSGPNRPDDVQWGVARGGAEEGHAEYARHYAAKDLRARRHFRLPDGKAITQLDLMTSDELRACPIHQELLPKWGIHHMLAVKASLGDGRVSLTSVLRPLNNEFDGECRRWIERLHPHVSNAVRLHLELLAARATSQSLAAGLDTLASAILLLDGTGAVLFANHAARTLLDAHNGLRLDRGKLSTVVAAPRGRLEAAMARALGKYGSVVGGDVAIERIEGRPLLVRVVPIPEPIDVVARRAAAIVLINDPDRQNGITPESLTGFGLTPAEAKLSAALAAGQSVEEYAERAGLQLHTVRSTLKSVFAKTDTHRQGELIALILRSTPLL